MHVERMRARFLEQRGEQALQRLLSEPYEAVGLRRTYGVLFPRLYRQGYWRREPGHVARFLARVLRPFVAEQLVDVRRIVDVGCGPQGLARALSYFSARVPRAVDLNPETFRYLGRTRRRAHEFVAPATALPLADGECDAVVWAHMLQYLTPAERVLALQEGGRIAQPGSLLAITFPYRHLDRQDFARWCEALQRSGVRLIEQYTGRVLALDDENRNPEELQPRRRGARRQRRRRPFRVWAIVGWIGRRRCLHQLTAADLQLRIERLEHVTVTGGRRRRPAPGVRAGERVQPPYDRFVVMDALQRAQRAVVTDQTDAPRRIVRALRRSRGSGSP